MMIFTDDVDSLQLHSYFWVQMFGMDADERWGKNQKSNFIQIFLYLLVNLCYLTTKKT